jgi:hypothetical protein
MSDFSGTVWNLRDYTDLSNSSVISRSRYWDTREGDVRKKLLRMTKAKENISFVYRECLRSMLNQFSDIVYFNDRGNAVDVKTIHANPERAIAKLTQENNIILPIISISQTVSKDANDRRRNKSVLVHEKLWDEEKKKAYRVLSFSPRAIDIEYELNIWCKYRSDIDQILEQIRLLFNPEMEVPTRYSTQAKAFISSESDSGSVLAADKEDRLIQKKITITLRTYIPSPKFLVTSTGQIEEFNIELYKRLRSQEGIVSVEGPEITPPPEPEDTTPPPAPENLSLNSGQTQVTLRWDAIPDVDGDLAGYNVYRSRTPINVITSQSVTKVADKITINFYIDRSLNLGITYYYVVTAEDENGNESDISNLVFGELVEPEDTTPPEAPTNLVANSGDGVVNLSWTASISPDVTTYSIYRSDTAAGNYTVLTDVGSAFTSYADNTVVNGETYYYKLTATDDNENESGFSNTAVGTPEEAGSSQDLTFNFNTEIVLDQYYLDTDTGNLGNGVIEQKSLLVNINSNDTFIRDNQNGLSYCMKYAKFDLESSFVPGTPRYPKAGVTYESLYPAYESGYISQKALGCHVIVTEHDAYPGSYEVSIMLSNGFQNNGFVYGNRLSFITTETVNNYTSQKEYPHPGYLRCRAALSAQLYVGPNKDNLRDCHHYDLNNEAKIPDLPGYGRYLQKCNDEVSKYDTRTGTFQTYGFVQPFLTQNTNMAASKGGIGIGPYYEWRKGRPGYRLWRREMWGEISRSNIVCVSPQDGLPFIVNGKIGGSLNDPGLVDPVDGDSFWQGTDNWDFHLAGFRELPLALGANVQVANNPIVNDVGASYLFRPTLNNRSFVDDGIFYNWTALYTAPGDGYSAPVNYRPFKWERHAFTHISREYRAARMLQHKDPLARLWMKWVYWGIKQHWDQTEFNDSSLRLLWGMERRINDVLADPLARSKGTMFADRGHYQPTRFLNEFRACLESQDEVSRMESLDSVKSKQLQAARLYDAAVTPNGVFLKEAPGFGAGQALLSCWAFNDAYQGQSFAESEGQIRVSRCFQNQLGLSLIADIERGRPGAFDFTDIPTAALDLQGQSINDNLLRGLQNFRDKLGADREMFNYFEEEYLDFYVQKREERFTVCRDNNLPYLQQTNTGRPLSFFGSCVPSDVQNVPNHPQYGSIDLTQYPKYWASIEDLTNFFDGGNPRIIGWYGGSYDTNYVTIPGSQAPTEITIGDTTYDARILDDGYYSNTSTQKGSNGVEFDIFNNPDSLDRYYYGLYFDRFFYGAGWVVFGGEPVENLNLSGFTGTGDWKVGNGDVWNYLLQIQYGGSGPIQNQELLECHNPEVYSHKLIDITASVNPNGNNQTI